MSKLTFKRLSLVVVAALGLGMLSTGPSNADVAKSETLTLSATTASIAAGETASVTITSGFIAEAAGESLTVNIVNQSVPTGGDGTIGLYNTDSANAYVLTDINATASAKAQQDYYGQTGRSVTTTIWGAYGLDTATTGGGSATKSVSASFSFRLMKPTVAGTYIYRVYLSETGAGDNTNFPDAQTITITVTASTASSGSATYSKFWMNDLATYTSGTAYARDANTTFHKTVEADSSLVVVAGTPAGTKTAYAVITPVIMNSSETKTSSLSSARVQESAVITISGAGALAAYSRYTGLSTSLVQSVTIAYDETAVVYNNGTPGTGTISMYVGTSATSNKLVAQGTKSIVFTGRATTFTASAGASSVRAVAPFCLMERAPTQMVAIL